MAVSRSLQLAFIGSLNVSLVASIPDLEAVIKSEKIRKRKTIVIHERTYVESRKMIQMILLAKQK